MVGIGKRSVAYMISEASIGDIVAAAALHDWLEEHPEDLVLLVARMDELARAAAYWDSCENEYLDVEQQYEQAAMCRKRLAHLDRVHQANFPF